MHTWHWQHQQALPYLTCSLLEPWAHGFFTRHWSPQLPDQFVTTLHPTAAAYRARQVHGDRVLTPSELATAPVEEEATLPAADGVLTETPDQSVWVCTADCTPVLIADETTGQVAAIHAGWRGTAQEIVPKAIERLLAQGSEIHHLRVALGPAISGAVYQVSTTVAAEVTGTIAPVQADDPLPEALEHLPNSPVLPDPHPERVRLDVRRVIELQLHHLGIRDDRIAIAPYCTFKDEAQFFSYRRDKQKSVQWSGIVSGLP